MAASMVPARRWHGRFLTILSDAETGGLRRTYTGPLRVLRPRRRGGWEAKSDYLEIGTPREVQKGCAVLPEPDRTPVLIYHPRTPTPDGARSSRLPLPDHWLIPGKAAEGEGGTNTLVA